MGVGLLGRDPSLVDQILDQRVVMGYLAEGTIAEQIGA